MKISRILLVLIVTVSVLSCKKSDDDTGPAAYTLSTANFVDTYSMNFLKIIAAETITFSNGSTSTSTTTTVGSVFQDVNYTFNANGTYTATGLYNTQKTVVQADGTVVEGSTMIENAMGNGTYNLNVASKVLILTDQDNNVSVYEIMLYSETEMRLIGEGEVTVGNSYTTINTDVRFTR